MSTLYDDLESNNINFEKDFIIKDLTNFKVGGRIDILISSDNIDSLKNAISILKKHKKEFIIIGKMTNLLISDNKIDKAFIQLSGDFAGIKIKNNNQIFIGSAVKNENLLEYLPNNDLGGLEFLSGIPGTIGGAIYMNAGAYGDSIGNHISKVYFLTHEGKLIELNQEGLFSYRNSIFQNMRGIILGADINVKKVDKEQSNALMREILEKRYSRHPWEANSAGSFFKNGQGYTAGDLIEKAGLKGFNIGDAQVSEKHGNFIINNGNASYKDIKKLAEHIKKVVYEKFNVKLEEEVISVE